MLEREVWTCAHCHKKTRGAECEHCETPRKDAVIVVPDGEVGEDMMDRLTTEKRCKRCVHFDHKMGQEMLHDDRDPFFHILVFEFELRSIAENMNWKEIGICKQWSGGPGQWYITSATSPARVNKGRLDPSTPRAEFDENVPCPAYDDKAFGSDGKKIKSYRMVKGGRTFGTD
jgi:hypothetical protein